MAPGKINPPSVVEQSTDKTIVIGEDAAQRKALLLPDELLSARKAPHPLYMFLAETLESFSISGSPESFLPQDEECTDPALPEADEIERSCRTPLENYDLKKKIAEGGQGYIHRAWDHQFRRTVAVKSLLTEKLHSPVRKAFFREAQVTAQLQHPGIVPIHNLWVDQGDCPHLAMKLVEGITLRKKLEKIRKFYDTLPWRKIASQERSQQKERLEIFLKICDAMAYAHSRNVLHRDLKPENIMLGRFGAVYVLDWGLATALSEEHDSIQFPVCGTPRYIAPEVLNHQPYGKAADVYQMGLILFELVYLRHAYPLADTTAAMAAGMEGKTAPQEHLYGCRTAPLLDRIIAKAIAFRPEDRYPQIRDLARDIHAYLNQSPVSVDKHPLWSAFTRMLMRHSQKLLALIAILTLLVFGLISWNLATILQNERRMEMRENVLRSVYGTHLRNVLTVGARFSEIDSMLKQLVREAETRLESLPEPDKNGKFYDAAAWRDPASCPPGFRYSVSQGMKASFEVPLYKFAGKPFPELKSYLTALTPMVRSCRKVIQWNSLETDARSAKTEDPAKTRTPVIAVNIGLQNGLLMTYPYSGIFPEDYDPRTRPWYAGGARQKQNQVHWTNPYLDTRANKIVISASAPVRDKQGRLIAVLGLDLEPDTMIRAFIQHDLTASHVHGRYLLNKNGRIIATDGNLKPSVKDGRLYRFPYQELFPEMQQLKTGRLFLDREETQLLIFHYLKPLDCFFAEVIDFGEMMRDTVPAAARGTGSEPDSLE